MASRWLRFCVWMPLLFSGDGLVVRHLTNRSSRHLFWKSLLSSRLSAVPNIVLEPTTDDTDAFDSFKIGSARVHRYNLRSDPDSEIEYVMWYHGRSHAMDTQGKSENDDKPSLPPLSTGRIGRATSKNGLSWKKTTRGSVSEDVNDVSLGLNTADWYGFDTLHVGLGNVLLPMRTPAVLAEGGVYLMYYFGGSCEETPMADYLDADRDIPEQFRGTSIAGMKMKIGVAVSQDGRTWGRVEGDDPSGACLVPYERKDPNQKDDPMIPPNMPEELYCAWPEVCVNLYAKKDKSANFLMYYSTMTKSDRQKCIGVATSEDGFRWFKKGICLSPDTSNSGLDAAGCARCCIIRDALFDDNTGNWKELDRWKMYYEGVSRDDGKHRILCAESQDGLSWTKIGMALDVGLSDEDAWDSGGVGAPHVVRVDDGFSRMYYTGQDANGKTAIGVAKLGGAGADPLWVREQATITFA